MNSVPFIHLLHLIKICPLLLLLKHILFLNSVSFDTSLYYREEEVQIFNVIQSSHLIV